MTPVAGTGITLVASLREALRSLTGLRILHLSGSAKHGTCVAVRVAFVVSFGAVAFRVCLRIIV